MCAATHPEAQHFSFGAHVVAAAFSGSGALAFGLGDGTIRIVANGGGSMAVEAHQGAVLSLAASRSHFISGGDDGRVVRCDQEGRRQTLHADPGRWIDAVACARAGAAIAASRGRDALIFTDAGALRTTLGPCASTIADLHFSPDGSRLAAVHYGGATIWPLSRTAARARHLTWKGSHLALRYSPSGKFLATATQENAIHVWRLADAHDMQMAGYTAKVKSLAWSADTAWLLASGAEVLTCWPFTGPGPEGRPPVEIGWADGALVTQVAAHPSAGFAAAGFENGTVLGADLTARRGALLAPARGVAVSALAWSPDGQHVAVGFADGAALRLQVGG